jgi:phenylacetate-CoA ligase
MHAPSSTCLPDELAELAKWRPRSAAVDMQVFQRFARREFLSADEHEASQAQALARMVQYAGVHSVFYRQFFQDHSMAASDIKGPADLPMLPVLSKQHLVEHSERLLSDSLPEGEGPATRTKSTGTTGQPVTVMMSRGNSRMFGLLWHRQARWFRYNLAGRFAKIRIPSTMPRQPDGSPVPPNCAQRRQSWLYVGEKFQTGYELTFSTKNPASLQVEWLRRFRPDYLLAYPGVFEELCFACEGSSPVDSLQSLLGIGATATPALRSRIEGVYGVPFDQNYGLNEIGLVAIRCAAGRYHVNTEHCLVEIVDGSGHPCAPGENGRLLVTALRNTAMPLFRYDTGDIAQAMGGSCPCGRTLPAFGEISGRFRRYTGLPEGTRQRVARLSEAMADMPVEFIRNLRRYQIYQNRNNHFQMRLRTVGPLPEEFANRLHEAWKPVEGDPPLPFTIEEVPSIEESPGGKILDFDSEFYTLDDRASIAKPGGRPGS